MTFFYHKSVTSTKLKQLSVCILLFFFAYINLPILINKEKTIKDEDEI